MQGKNLLFLREGVKNGFLFCNFFLMRMLDIYPFNLLHGLAGTETSLLSPLSSLELVAWILNTVNTKH